MSSPNLTGAILTDWDEARSNAFGRELVVARHTLHQRPMFSPEGVARLLDAYPRDRLGIYTMDNERHDSASFRHGLAGELSGAEILELVARGRFWLNLRAANEHLPDYAQLTDEMFGEFDRLSGVRTMKRDMGVLISSPNARVFYHLDIPLVALWQIQGVKRMWVYPAGGRFAPDEQVESVALRETEEEISYDPAFDASAQLVTMEPGVMATWPQTAPHRIDNTDTVNVSLSCEFMTMKALIHANALFANGAMRRWWGLNPSIARDTDAMKAAKAVLARGMKLAKGRRAFERRKPPAFILDPNADSGMRDLRS